MAQETVELDMQQVLDEDHDRFSPSGEDGSLPADTGPGAFSATSSEELPQPDEERVEGQGDLTGQGHLSFE